MTVADLFDTVLDFFAAENWEVSQAGTEPAVSLEFQGQHGRWTCFAEIRQPFEQFLFYSIAPLRVAPDRRMEVAEFLTRANYGLPLGSFEMDLDEGDIHFKTGIDVEGEELTQGLVKHVVYTNVIMMDRYLPGIERVATGTSPREAIGQIEGTG
jgi:hypothetical protein